MTHRVLIVGQSQFGSLVDTYQYCRHLQGPIDFTYICWDYGNKPLELEGTRVILVSRSGGKVQRLGRLIRRAREEMLSARYDLCVVVYFEGCSLLRTASRALPTVLDIRTGYVRGGKVQTFLHNRLLLLESMLYRHVSIISDGLRKQLRLREEKCQVIPLGADPVDAGDKEFTALRLLYVGTLQHRRIHETVRGFCMFYKGSPDRTSSTYEIVGTGSPSDVEALRTAIAERDESSRIRFVGRVSHAELRPFLVHNNVGVAYIPITPEFDNQPSTKVFEYLLAGMAVIATETSENRRLVNMKNGVLCRDTPEGFCEALAQLSDSRGHYDSSVIRGGTSSFTWRHITHNQLLPYWESLMPHIKR